MKACGSGHPDVVKLLLDHSEQLNIDLNVKDENRMTAFMWACQNGHKDVVKLLLDHSEQQSIDVNAKDDAKKTRMLKSLIQKKSGPKSQFL